MKSLQVDDGRPMGTEIRPGYYMAPALNIRTTTTTRFNRQGTFGPLSTVLRARSYDKVLALTNDTPVGLSADFAITSLHDYKDSKRNSQTGMVMANLATARVDYPVPYGAYTGSSYRSRERGRYTAQFYTTVSTAHIQA